MSDNRSIGFGCPMWHHDQWRGHWLSSGSSGETSLRQYSRVFNSIEGNTSFYHLPDESSLRRWQQAVSAGFRFCFKFPQQVSHGQDLDEHSDELNVFLTRMGLLEEQIGLLMLQLPARFSPAQLPRLNRFLSALPREFDYGVEVRHPEFFQNVSYARQLNELLTSHRVNRIIMDTQGLFAARANNELLKEVQHKKPKVPVHVVTTADKPVVRYVGHPSLASNPQWYRRWQTKLEQWQRAGKQPFMFFHMPDNAYAPWLAKHFARDWANQSQAPGFQVDIPDRVEQGGLF
ncbi:UPF0759 protein [Saliniradius amylolyticus]|uniref:UPF0759 protein n=1 Tax=Saliniradius amylolyticus TaxID=2183582 RepID=A0A2S2E521_9ALTE|nr:DUF72 domain-containing protein [Saliniradius amylolyticus]AWL12330.1 UPF0759 protein [Saliniradius amylolyticus]